MCLFSERKYIKALKVRLKQVAVFSLFCEWCFLQAVGSLWWPEICEVVFLQLFSFSTLGLMLFRLCQDYIVNLDKGKQCCITGLFSCYSLYVVLRKDVWLTKHVFLSFQWRSSAEPWLWIHPFSRRILPCPACPWGLLTCAGRLRCPSTTKWLLPLCTTSSERLWTCSTAHGTSIRPDSRFGSCVMMTVCDISCEEKTVVQ